MKIIISTTNAFCKWLKLDLPRLPSPDGKKVGTQTLITNADLVAWQCHVIRKHARSHNATVIAVEARSRYAIIISYSILPSQEKFEQDLLRQWGNQVGHLMLESGALSNNNIPAVLTQFKNTPANFEWVKNTDLSVNGHVSDTEQWVLQSFERYGIKSFDEGEAFGLTLHINQMLKKAKSPLGYKEKFYPVARFVDDGLFRFAKGLSNDHYPNTTEDDFPSPYKNIPIQAAKKTPPHKTGKKNNNVISLSEFKKCREQ